MAAQVQSQKATFESGAYTYRAYWNGKEYSGGRRFVNVIGVDNKREYKIIANAAGEILENAKGFSGAQAAIKALGWK
jgi:hypothetical protein